MTQNKLHGTSNEGNVIKWEDNGEALLPGFWRGQGIVE